MEALRIDPSRESAWNIVDRDGEMLHRELRQILIVDHSLSDIERVTQLLRTAGLVVNLHAAGNESGVLERLRSERLELALVRVTPELPSVKSVVAGVRTLGIDLPVVALLGSDGPQPAELLRAGADDVVINDDPVHLALVVEKELRRHRQRVLAQSLWSRQQEIEARLEALLESLSEPVAYVQSGRHTRANSAYCRMLGYDSESALSGVPIAAIAAEPQQRQALAAALSEVSNSASKPLVLAVRGLHADGLTTFPMQMDCTPVRFGGRVGFQVVIRTTASVTMTCGEGGADPVTGLLDRRSFYNLLNAERDDRAAVLYILLTGYRTSAREIGLEATDRLAIDIGTCISEIVADQGKVAHFSDAVFSVCLEHCTEQDALRVARCIREAVREHVTHVAQKLVLTSCAIGLTVFEGNRLTAVELLTQADQACEVARRAGENEIRLYEAPVEPASISAEQRDADAIRAAISAGCVEVCYQPIAAFAEAECERFAVSARIPADAPDFRVPDITLSSTEPALLRKLERLIIAKALEQLALAQCEGRTSVTLFVPVSVATLVEHEFLGWVEMQLASLACPGGSIVFEIDEAIAESHFAEVKRFDAAVRRLACGLCLMNAAQGARSERLLQHLKPTFASIDSKLIDNISNPRNSALREGLLAYAERARELGTQLVATNIRCASQMAGIWEFGIALVRGDLVQQATTEMGFDFNQFSA